MTQIPAIAMVGLLCAAPAWAGSTGNGSPRPVGQFVFCYGGNVKVVYMTQIMPLAAQTDAPSLGVSFANYVKANYGIPSIDRQRCVTGFTNTDLAAARQSYMGMFGKTKIVEINWGG